MKIAQAFTFEAAHRLPNVPDTHRCHRLHGHSYRSRSCVSKVQSTRTRVSLLISSTLRRHSIRYLFASTITVSMRWMALRTRLLKTYAVWIWDRVKPLLPQTTSVVVYETPIAGPSTTAKARGVYT